MKKLLLALIPLLMAAGNVPAQVVNQPSTITITVTPACSAISLASTSFSGGPNNANAVVGAVTVTTNPPGGTYAGTLTLGGASGASFALTNGGHTPSNLTIGPSNLAAGSYAITLSCT